MCFGGTESLRVTVHNFSASEISTDSLFANANEANDATSKGKQEPAFVSTTSPAKEMPRTKVATKLNNTF
jgi:hypothetical protein